MKSAVLGREHNNNNLQPDEHEYQTSTKQFCKDTSSTTDNDTWTNGGQGNYPRDASIRRIYSTNTSSGSVTNGQSSYLACANRKITDSSSKNSPEDLVRNGQSNDLSNSNSNRRILSEELAVNAEQSNYVSTSIGNTYQLLPTSRNLITTNIPSLKPFPSKTTTDREPLKDDSPSNRDASFMPLRSNTKSLNLPLNRNTSKLSRSEDIQIDADAKHNRTTNSKEVFLKSTSSSSLRKTSMTRLGNAFRELQQTIKPRRHRIRHNKTVSSIPDWSSQKSQHQQGKKQVSRSSSLPNIKNNVEKENRRNARNNSSFLGSRVFSKQTNQNKSTSTILDFDSIDVISFPSERLNGYRTKSKDPVFFTVDENSSFPENSSNDDCEIDRIRERKLHGRSRSVQLPSDTVTKQLVTRERSFSTDCDQHLFSFDKLVERRLNSSKETQLCETDL